LRGQLRGQVRLQCATRVSEVNISSVCGVVADVLGGGGGWVGGEGWGGGVQCHSYLLAHRVEHHCAAVDDDRQQLQEAIGGGRVVEGHCTTGEKVASFRHSTDYSTVHSLRHTCGSIGALDHSRIVYKSRTEPTKVPPTKHGGVHCTTHKRTHSPQSYTTHRSRHRHRVGRARAYSTQHLK
jgi:hypothetical protein